MHRLCFILIILISSLPIICANERIATEQLLFRLDSVISNRDKYLETKLSNLSNLHKDLTDVGKNDKEIFEALGRLYSEYHSFNTDSAYIMAQRQLSLAQNIGDENLTMNAMLNKANILCNVGMYHEALALVDSISIKALPDYLRAYYFHSKRTLYGNLANFAAFGPDKDYYENITDAYRDSLLTVNDPESIFYAIIKADQLNVHNHPKEAVELLESFIKNNNLS